MKEIIHWTFSMIPGLWVFIIAAFIIFGFIIGAVVWMIARHVNYKQWPIEHQKEMIFLSEENKRLEHNLQIVTTAYNERYACDKQIIHILTSIDNRFLKRRKQS